MYLPWIRGDDCILFFVLYLPRHPVASSETKKFTCKFMLKEPSNGWVVGLQEWLSSVLKSFWILSPYLYTLFSSSKSAFSRWQKNVTVESSHAETSSLFQMFKISVSESIIQFAQSTLSSISNIIQMKAVSPPKKGMLYSKPRGEDILCLFS